MLIAWWYGQRDIEVRDIILAHYDGWKTWFELPPSYSPLWSYSAFMKLPFQLLWYYLTWGKKTCFQEQEPFERVSINQLISSIPIWGFPQQILFRSLLVPKYLLYRALYAYLCIISYFEDHRAWAKLEPYSTFDLLYHIHPLVPPLRLFLLQSRLYCLVNLIQLSFYDCFTHCIDDSSFLCSYFHWHS